MNGFNLQRIRQARSMEAAIIPAVLCCLTVRLPSCAAVPQNGDPTARKPAAACAQQLPLYLLDATGAYAGKTSVPQAHYAEGLKLYAAGDQAGAEREFRAAVAGEPSHPDYVHRLASLYITEARYEAAAALVRDYTKLCGPTALGYGLEGELLFQQRDYDAALTAVTSSLGLSANSARMHELLGLILFTKRQNVGSRSELEKAEQLEPDNAEIRYFYGRSLYLTGLYAEAREQFLACVRIDPSYRKCRENLGLCYQALRDYAKAAEAFKEAIALEKAQSGPKHGEPFGYYGAMLAETGQSLQALPILREGEKLCPRSLVVNYELGRILLGDGDLDQAERYLLVAENLDPTFAQTYYLLGKVHQRQGRADQAALDWNRFQELHKDPANREFPLTDR